MCSSQKSQRFCEIISCDILLVLYSYRIMHEEIWWLLFRCTCSCILLYPIFHLMTHILIRQHKNNNKNQILIVFIDGYKLVQASDWHTTKSGSDTKGLMTNTILQVCQQQIFTTMLFTDSFLIEFDILTFFSHDTCTCKSKGKMVMVYFRSSELRLITIISYDFYNIVCVVIHP